MGRFALIFSIFIKPIVSIGCFVGLTGSLLDEFSFSSVSISENSSLSPRKELTASSDGSSDKLLLLNGYPLHSGKC